MKQTIHIIFIFVLIALTLVAACNPVTDNLDMRCPGPTSGESFVYNEIKTGSCGSSSSSSSGCDVSLIFSIPSDASNVFATLKMAGDFYFPSSEYATVKLNGTTFDIVSTEKQETTLRSPDGWSDKLLPARFWTAGGTLTILLDASSSVSRWYSNGTYQPAASYEVTLQYVDYRFESSSISGNFTMSGNANWQTDNESALGGASAARSGTLSSGQTSCMSLPVQNAGEVKFHQTVDSDSCEDYLSFYVNDVEQTDLRISGYKAWQGQKTTVTANSTLKWCYTKGSTSGSAYAWLDEINTPDNVPTTVTTISLDDGTVPSNFTMSGNASWYITSSTYASENYSLRSGSISGSQSSCVSLTASTSSDTLSFYYKVSSESGYDSLKFYIDNTQYKSASGSVGWSVYSTWISSGSHTFKWCYSKDGSVSHGSDAAWIDDISLPSTN